MRYLELNKERQAKIDAFISENGFFHFGDDREDLKVKARGKKIKLGDLIYVGMGLYIRKDKKDDLMSLLVAKPIIKILVEEGNRDEVVRAFGYELGNHEFGYTWDDSDAVSALGLNPEELDEYLAGCLQDAKDKFYKENE